MPSRQILIVVVALTAFLNATTARAVDHFMGHTVNVVERGQGPTIVLVHGLGADASRWQANIDVLAQSHRVIAVDLLGFGQSDKPNIHYRMQVYVDQIRSLLDARGISEAILIGNSMGGLVSLLFAEQHPNLVQGLVLVAPAFVFGLADGVSAERLMAGASPETPQAMSAYLGRIYHQPDLSDSSIESALARKRAVGDSGTVSSISESLFRGEDVLTPDRIRDISNATLIIHGTSDGVVAVSNSEQIHQLMPNTELIVRKEVGHWPQLEDAVFFNATIMSWLQTVDYE